MDNIVANRVEHQFTDRMEIEFPHNIGAVRFRSLYTEIKYDSHFF